MTEIFIIILITILGAVIGSFLGCMGYRIPNKIKTSYPSSFCPHCKKPLKWYMNIPIISYIFLKGKCAYCKKPINFIYVFVEIACALLFLCNYLMFGFGFEFFIGTILTCALMVTIVSDFLYFYISDRVLIISGIALIITLLFFLEVKEAIFYIISGAAMFLIMLGIKYAGNIIFKRESLGDGDIKLMGIIGLSSGVIYSLISLSLASFIGLFFSLLISKKNKEGIIPFGPFLLMGALISLYFKEYFDVFIDLLV